MKRSALSLCLLMAAPFMLLAAPPGDSTKAAEAYQQFVDSVNNSLKYQTGKIGLNEGNVNLNVPLGYKFLDAKQSRYVLTDLWGNPEANAEGVLGMIFPDSSNPFETDNYVFVISYEELGYVKDDDAQDINYDELLANLQKEEKKENIQRLKEGYPALHLIGWAQKPFYDKDRKILHWAKEIQFGETAEGPNNTLNYEIRILGKKGVLCMNAVSSMNVLPKVNKDLPRILNVASFTTGNTYHDFNPPA